MKMKNKYKMTMSTAILIVLMLITSTVISMLVIPNADAQDLEPGKISVPTYAFVSVAPNPVGVGQTVTINFFLNQVPPTAYLYYGDRWHDMTILVTKPNEETQTLGPFSTDATGGYFATYTPDQQGIYTFVLNFPGQIITGENPHPILGTIAPESVGNYFMPSTSEEAELVVQETPIEYSPVTPLPTEYWTRPIFAMNTEWYSISGNWLGHGNGAGGFAVTGLYSANSNFNPYTKGPNTAHILWTAPYAPGGLIGGEFGYSQEDSNFKSTSQYEPNWSPIVMNGILYYSQYLGAGSNPTGFVAVDLQTGETLWIKNYNELLLFGQLFDYVSPNQYGATPYLWGSGLDITGGSEGTPALNGTFSMFDSDGNWILNMNNGPSWGWGCVPTQDESGSMILYYSNFTDFTVNCWNSSKAIAQYGLTTGQNTNLWAWRPPQGAEIDWSYGMEWTAPIPWEIDGVPIDNAYLMINKVADGTVLLNGYPNDWGPGGYNLWVPGYIYQAGLDAYTGETLWGPLNATRAPWTKISGNLYDLGVGGDGLWVEYTSELATWDAYSLATGKHVWGPVSGDHNSLSYHNIHSDMAYGTLYAADYGGYVNAFNWTTGELLWTWNTGSSGLDSPYSNWPVLHIDVIADGKLYIMGGHTYSPPLFHYAQLYCLNATTGSEMWSINCFTTTNGPEAAIVDGILLEPNAYDNQIYAFGMGPTKLTVSAPAVGVTTSTPITISGTISDISPGADQLAVAKNFPNGLPCVSDESMTQFMEAVYQQQPMPTNTTGVPIILNVMDSNGNYRQIGTATSNSLGTYSYTWTPDIPGDFTVFASFEGTESYYPSEAAAAFFASETPAPTAAPTASPAPMTDTIVTGFGIGAIIAIVVIGLVIILMLRKR